jgi:hypothetical protein
MTTTALGVSSYRPQRTKYSPVSDSGADEHTATAMNSTKRPHTSALPVILSGNDALHSRSAQIRNASARANVDAACAYPLFVPPHAYETFISHEPPPTDSWITVETTPGEHRLLVRLPGFKRNGMCVSLPCCLALLLINGVVHSFIRSFVQPSVQLWPLFILPRTHLPFPHSYSFLRPLIHLTLTN